TLGRQNSSDSRNCNCRDFSLAANSNSDYVPTKVGLDAEKGQISLDSPKRVQEMRLSRVNCPSTRATAFGAKQPFEVSLNSRKSLGCQGGHFPLVCSGSQRHVRRIHDRTRCKMLTRERQIGRASCRERV